LLDDAADAVSIRIEAPPVDLFFKGRRQAIKQPFEPVVGRPWASREIGWLSFGGAVEADGRAKPSIDVFERVIRVRRGTQKVHAQIRVLLQSSPDLPQLSDRAV
jgi:hypothetical protein